MILDSNRTCYVVDLSSQNAVLYSCEVINQLKSHCCLCLTTKSMNVVRLRHKRKLHALCIHLAAFSHALGSHKQSRCAFTRALRQLCDRPLGDYHTYSHTTFNIRQLHNMLRSCASHIRHTSTRIPQT